MSKSENDVLALLVDIEKTAEDILTKKQEIVDLDRKRNSNREAIRALEASAKVHYKKDDSKCWLAMGNSFFRLPNKNAVNMLKNDQIKLDNSVNKLRSDLRDEVILLREKEGKEELKGFGLKAISKEELNAVNGVINANAKPTPIEKKRKKIKKLVEAKMKSGKSENEAKKEVMKEQRLLSKEKKTQDLDKIKQKVEKDMEGQDAKLIDKAVKKAIAKFHSEKKKLKNPKHRIKQQASKLIQNVNSDLWFPNTQSWWDQECQNQFDDLQFLAGCWNIDLIKSPQNFSNIYPDECKTYFDLLAKKRFNSTDEKSKQLKKNKTVLEKKFEEKKADSSNQKADNVLMKEVMTEMMKANQTAVLKDMLKSWKPSHKPFFDKECQEAWDKLNEQASKQGFDLDSNVNDFKKFKRKNKLECKKYFKLLTTKREAFDVKKIIKEERKASNKKKHLNVETDNAYDQIEPPPNKKIKFEEEVEENTVPAKKPKKAKKSKNVDEAQEPKMAGEEGVLENNDNENIKKSKKTKKVKNFEETQQSKKAGEEEVVENIATEKIKKSKKAKKAKKVKEEE